MEHFCFALERQKTVPYFLKLYLKNRDNNYSNSNSRFKITDDKSIIAEMSSRIVNNIDMLQLSLISLLVHPYKIFKIPILELMWQVKWEY